MGGPDKSGLSFVSTYALSATSACIAETATFPVRTVALAQRKKAMEGTQRWYSGSVRGSGR